MIVIIEDDKFEQGVQAVKYLGEAIKELTEVFELTYSYIDFAFSIIDLLFVKEIRRFTITGFSIPCFFSINIQPHCRSPT